MSVPCKIILVLAFTMLLLCSCANSRSDVYEPGSSESLGRIIESLDDAISKASDIVIGYVVQENDFEGASETEFVVRVESCLKGCTEPEIYVYDDKMEMNINSGERYVMFLSWFDGTALPHPTYTSIDKKLIYKIESDNSLSSLVDRKWKNDQTTLSQLKKHVTDVVSRQPTNVIKWEVVDSFPTVSEYVEFSNLIVRAKVTQNIDGNQHVYVMRIDVKEFLKGSYVTDSFIMNIPIRDEIQVGKEYILFLINDEEGIFIATRYGSILKPDQAEWEEALQILR